MLDLTSSYSLLLLLWSVPQNTRKVFTSDKWRLVLPRHTQLVAEPSSMRKEKPRPLQRSSRGCPVLRNLGFPLPFAISPRPLPKDSPALAVNSKWKMCQDTSKEVKNKRELWEETEKFSSVFTCLDSLLLNCFPQVPDQGYSSCVYGAYGCESKYINIMIWHR